jgi:hypothetical protein
MKKQTFDKEAGSHATRLDRTDQNQLNLFSQQPEQDNSSAD